MSKTTRTPQLLITAEDRAIATAAGFDTVSVARGRRALAAALAGLGPSEPTPGHEVARAAVILDRALRRQAAGEDVEPAA